MSALEDTLAFQLDALGIPYTREYKALPTRKFRWDFAFRDERVLVEVQGGTFNGGAHGRGVGIHRDYEKGNLAQMAGWRVLQFDSKMVKSGEAVEVIRKALEVE